jgi:hypothetical protein
MVRPELATCASGSLQYSRSNPARSAAASVPGSSSGRVASTGTPKVGSMRPPSWMRWSMRYSTNTTIAATASATGSTSASISMLLGKTRDGV